MKILRIIARLNIGGPARNAVLLTEGFSNQPRRLPTCPPKPWRRRKATYEVDYETVLVCGEAGRSEGDMTYLAQQKGIKPVIIKELGRELSWKDDWAAFWEIYKIIREVKPDIIHTHTAKAGALGRLAGILYRLLRPSTSSRPLIAKGGASLGAPFGRRPPQKQWRTPRNDASACHCEAAGRSNLALIHTFHGHVFSGYFGKVKTLFFIWVERFLALSTDKIITVSENLKKELVEKYRIAPENKISVIELGFELNELFKLAPRESSEAINIGIAGRLVSIKNHRMLFMAIKKVVGAVSDRPLLKLIIIGDGEMRENLEKYAEELGIIDSVEFRGWEKDLKVIYEELDIVVLTSLNEGTPVSLIEAMAAGRPVVATNVGGVRDIVKDGVSGYLVGSGNVEEFTGKLLELIKDPEKRRTFGCNGRMMVQERFSKERLIKDTERLYNTILQKK